MADDTQAQDVPEKETQDSPMPSEEQQTPAPENDGQVAQHEEATDIETEGELPAEVSERTAQQFDKLRQQLREERERRAAIEGAYRTLQPQETPTPLIDPDTGYLDEQALTAIQREAQQARMEAQQLRAEMNQAQMDAENRETYTVHPELDPNGKAFDKKLHVATRQILLDAMLNPQDYGDKQLSFKEAADMAKGMTQADKARADGAREAIEQLTPKEQASLEASGSSQRSRVVAGAQEVEDLRRRSRKGDPEAIVARLNALDGKA